MTWPHPIRLFFATIAILSIPSFASVSVSTPDNGQNVNSPSNYQASSSSSCSKGVASMGVYVDNKLEYVVNGNSLNTNVSMSPGGHHTVVEEWDYCGGATYTSVDVTVSNQSGVTVTAPANGGSSGSPVNYAASATTTCGKGVASMGIYVNNKLTYVGQGSKLNTSVSLSPGTYNTVVEEWDYCGGAAYTPVQITVTSGGGGGGGGGGNTFSNLQASGGWKAYGEYPPNYDICTDCGPGVTWSMYQHISSPSLSGNSSKFSIGGTHPYADVLWTNPLIGTYSSQGMPDSDHKIIPNLHYFTYDIEFYGSNLQLAQDLEFDINQYFNGMGFTWGHQCNIGNGHQFDIWDNVHSHWIHTGVPCNPVNNGWNHLTLQVQRTSDNQLQYHSITFNGSTKVLDWYYPHFSCGNWYGVSVNYQEDGNSSQSPYSVYVDKLNLTYQ